MGSPRRTAVSIGLQFGPNAAATAASAATAAATGATRCMVAKKRLAAPRRAHGSGVDR